MLQKHNIVVKICSNYLTQVVGASSLRTVKEDLRRRMSLYQRQFGRWILAAGIGLALGACAVVERVGQEEAKQVVSAKSLERWDLVMKGQTDKAYGYFSPASRSALSPEAFAKRTRSSHKFRKVALASIDCGVDTCRVRIVLEYDIREIKGLKTTFEETWIKEADTWWLGDAG
jgi:hypothetical protein